MNKAELIKLSKNMVKEYFNRYVANDKNEIGKITNYNIQLLDYIGVRGHAKVLLCVPKYNQGQEIIYEVSYDKKTGAIDSSIVISN